MDDRNDIYVELGFEFMLESIYGTKSLRAGWKALKYFRQELIKLSKTLKRAVEKNAHGDAAHVKRIVESFEQFETYARNLKSKDELMQAALRLFIETQFDLLGRFPNNWQPGRQGKAHYSKYLELSQYRTLNYVRTAEQRVQEIVDYAYKTCDMSHKESLFTRLIDIKRKHSGSPDKVLEWIQQNEPDTFSKFNQF